MSDYPTSLTSSEYVTRLQELACLDPDFSEILNRFGNPPFWSRPPGFPTLVYIILEQQVSLASARSAFARLIEASKSLTPTRFLALDDHKLKEIGFSRQKTAYCREIAQHIITGSLDLHSLEHRKDSEVREILLRFRGIGPWTTEIYLLMALNRPDAWPSGDLALKKAAQQVKHLREIPTTGEMEEISLIWRPWRAVAARLLWHHYLSSREM